MKKIKREFLKIKKQTQSLINAVNTAEKNHIQNYLYFFHYPVASLAESVVLLCEEKKTNSAKILLRTLFESHINIIYHQVDDTEHRLAVSAKDGFDEKLKNIRGVQELIQKFPNLESKDPTRLFSREWLQKAAIWAGDQRQSVIRGSHLNESEKPLDLKAKAMRCDQVEVKGAEPGHFRRMYEVIYRQLSQPSHMSLDGLHNYVSQDESGKYLFAEEDEGLFLSTQAIEIYFALVKDLYENGVLSGEVPKEIQLTEDLIKRLEQSKSN